MKLKEREKNKIKGNKNYISKDMVRKDGRRGGSSFDRFDGWIERGENEKIISCHHVILSRLK